MKLNVLYIQKIQTYNEELNEPKEEEKKVSYQSIASRMENNWLSAFFVMTSILAAPTSFLLISPPTEEDLLLTAFLSFLPGWVLHTLHSILHQLVMIFAILFLELV